MRSAIPRSRVSVRSSALSSVRSRLSSPAVGSSSKQQCRLPGKCPSDCHPALLAARKLTGPAAYQLGGSANSASRTRVVSGARSRASSESNVRTHIGDGVGHVLPTYLDPPAAHRHAREYCPGPGSTSALRGTVPPAPVIATAGDKPSHRASTRTSRLPTTNSGKASVRSLPYGGPSFRGELGDELTAARQTSRWLRSTGGLISSPGG